MMVVMIMVVVAVTAGTLERRAISLFVSVGPVRPYDMQVSSLRHDAVTRLSGEQRARTMHNTIWSGWSRVVHPQLVALLADQGQPRVVRGCEAFPHLTAPLRRWPCARLRRDVMSRVMQ